MPRHGADKAFRRRRPRLDRVYSRWGRHSLTYRAGSHLVFLGRQRAVRRRAIERLGLDEGDTVLDLACGQGVNFGCLVEAVGPSGRVIGLDANPDMLGVAHERIERADWRNVELVEGDASRAHFDEGSLDGALCTLALSVIPDYQAAIRLVRDALRPGTGFVVLDAQLFRGVGRPLNALIKPVFRWTTGWEWDRDLPAALRAEFGRVEVEALNAGSLFVAAATKTPAGGPGEPSQV